MAKNLVVCCDGTNNEFGAENTNVVRLVQSLSHDAARQVIFYDPGVGTMPEPGFVTRIGKWWSKVMGLAFGAGISDNIAEAYGFLMDHYEPGDRIYLFGFSRGAYTVRALAGVLHQFGLLPPQSDNLLPYMMRLSRAVDELDDDDAEGRKKYWAVCRGFRATFARRRTTRGARARPKRVEFVGVWDTVSSVGWVWDPKRFPYTKTNPSVNVLRHAVSIDERRCFFRQNRWHRPDEAGERPQDVREVYFPGVHSDVGGGYPVAETGLWRGAFIWMLREAKRQGLLVEPGTVRAIVRHPDDRPDGWAERQNNSLTAAWWGAEFFPKWRAKKRGGIRLPTFGMFGWREIQDGELIHREALLRIRHDPTYRPKNLSAEFLESVRRLPVVPETLPYRA